MNIVTAFMAAMFPDTLAKRVRKHANHLALSHQSARARIRDAKNICQSICDFTVRDFEKKKKRTLAKTESAIFELIESARLEENEVEVTYATAKETIKRKREICDELTGVCRALGTEKFPLD